MDKKFIGEKEALKILFNRRNYKSRRAYIKTLFMFAAIILAAAICLVFVFEYYKSQNVVAKKITEHQAFVKKGQDRLSKELDSKVGDLKKQMEPMIDKKDDIRMKTDEVMEFERVNSARKSQRAEEKKQDEYHCALEILMGDESCKKKYQEKYDIRFRGGGDGFYEDLDCYKKIQGELFNFRGWIIAKHNLVAKYKEDIERIESLSEIDSWNMATLQKKKAFIEDAKKYNPNATDQELVQMILNAKTSDNYIKKCADIADKAIPHGTARL